MTDQTMTGQESDRDAFNSTMDIISAFPNLKEVHASEMSLSRMETSVDPVDGFNDEQRAVYARAIIREMRPLLNKLSRAVRAKAWDDSSLVHLSDLALFMIETFEWQNIDDINLHRQCKRIEALAEELAVAESKNQLTNDELIKAAGAEEINSQRNALTKEWWATLKTDEKGRAIPNAALDEKIHALDEQYEQKIAAFLFAPATTPSRSNGRD
jgi:hypothetical protein